MKKYKTKITLAQTSRGVWGLDPFKGCDCGLENNKNGCYGICYAVKIAKSRGYDFSKLVYRDFVGNKHFKSICFYLSRIPFVRLGVMCDPSSDWGHTLKIIEKIRPYQKHIVIVTKHWTNLTEDQLLKLKGLSVNTSISALDTDRQIKHRLYWYEKLKKYCNSILRVNTADFNNASMIEKQNNLLDNENVINTILRVPKSHDFVENKTLRVERIRFLKTDVYASSFNPSTYFGHCYGCLDLCGLGFMKNKEITWKQQAGINTQEQYELGLAF